MRRIRAGEMEAHQEPRAQGHTWRVVIPDEAVEDGHEELVGELHTLREMVAMFQTQVEADREELTAKNEQIRELHVLLQQAQAALPAPRHNHSWWRFWQR